MADLSPLDVLGASFGSRLKGYDPREVHEFLTHVAASMESVSKERGELRQQMHRVERELAGFKERERALHEALVAAQRSAESTVETARKEADRIVAEARSDAERLIEEGQNLADRLIEEAHLRAQNIDSVISQLRTRRRELRGELMRLSEILQGVIRDDQEQERREPPTPQLAVLNRHRARSVEGSA
jgi:cell division initiation protein